MPQCIQCSEYTKFNRCVRLKCYNDKKDGTSTIEEAEPQLIINKGGLTEEQNKYYYNIIKGRIGENLIQELFLSLDYNVFRFEMENTIPGIMELLKGVRNDVAQEIRRMPDFVMQNPPQGVFCDQ
jgi:hypothetical protein